MNDEKRLVTQLVDVLNAYEGKKTLFACQGQSMDGYSALANFLDIVRKIRVIRTEDEAEIIAEQEQERLMLIMQQSVRRLI